MDLRIITKHHAADSEIEFLTKSILKLYGHGTAIPTAWELRLKAGRRFPEGSWHLFAPISVNSGIPGISILQPSSSDNLKCNWLNSSGSISLINFRTLSFPKKCRDKSRNSDRFSNRGDFPSMTPSNKIASSSDLSFFATFSRNLIASLMEWQVLAFKVRLLPELRLIRQSISASWIVL